jgi:glycine/D-amino acid oxidase-like deaminating enzyme
VDVAIVGAGFSGLAAAYELKRAQPGLRVAVLEAMHVGYGASGRNGSFAMTVVGLGFGTMAMLHGKQWLKDAHTYMERAVDYLDETIQREAIQCECIRPGFLRTATTEGYVRRIQHDVEMMQALGFQGIEWIDADAVQTRINSPRYLGAMLEQRLLLIDPVKLVREEKRLVQAMGVAVYENTPVLEVFSKPRFTLTAPGGSVTAEKVVFATNAYSHLLAPMRHREMPAFTYMIATEPLSPAQLEAVGWSGREGSPRMPMTARTVEATGRRLRPNRITVGVPWPGMYAPLVSITAVRSWAGTHSSMSFLPNSRFMNELAVIIPA